MPNNILLSANQLKIGFEDWHATTILMDQFSYEFCGGHAYMLKGDNGAGKSTLLHSLCGVQAVLAGEIKINSKITLLAHQLGGNHRATLLDNLYKNAYLYAGCRQNKTAIAASATVFLRQFSLEHLHAHSLAQLSCGQQKIIALSRFWFSSAKLWVLDEPFAALDANYSELIGAKFNEHIQAGGAIIFSNHQAKLPACLAYRQLDLAQYKPCSDC